MRIRYDSFLWSPYLTSSASSVPAFRLRVHRVLVPHSQMPPTTMVITISRVYTLARSMGCGSDCDCDLYALNAYSTTHPACPLARSHTHSHSLTHSLARRTMCGPRLGWNSFVFRVCCWNEAGDNVCLGGSVDRIAPRFNHGQV
jgi:hypothetical protein